MPSPAFAARNTGIPGGHQKEGIPGNAYRSRAWLSHLGRVLICAKIPTTGNFHYGFLPPRRAQRFRRLLHECSDYNDPSADCHHIERANIPSRPVSRNSHSFPSRGFTCGSLKLSSPIWAMRSASRRNLACMSAGSAAISAATVSLRIWPRQGRGRADCLFSPSAFFSGSMGRYVSMCRPRHCPGHFSRFLNVSVRGFANILKRGNLWLRPWDFRRVDTLKRGLGNRRMHFRMSSTPLRGVHPFSVDGSHRVRGHAVR
jgi:hypothetical protein